MSVQLNEEGRIVAFVSEIGFDYITPPAQIQKLDEVLADLYISTGEENND